MKGAWLNNVDKIYATDESFGILLDTLGVNADNTYVVIGNGCKVHGVTPCITKPVLSRRITLTQCGTEPWCAVDVCATPGCDYDFGQEMNHLILYEFSDDFTSYLVDAEFETEVTLSKQMKVELSNALDSIIGEHSAYWNLWEMKEPDDIVEIYGNLSDPKDAIVEIYSPPRVVAAAAARGLQASLSIDLTNGYDLSKPEVRKSVRDDVAQRKPRLVVTSPPCTKFSPLQNIRAYPERLEAELEPAIEHVDFSMTLLQDQLQRGDHGLHEHPDTATSWGLPKVKEYLANDEVLLVKAHLCRFGLKIQNKLSRKSTLFATTCDAIAVQLQKLCQCEAPHQRLEQGLPQLAQLYPPELVKAIVDGLIQDWIDEQQGKPKRMPDLGDLEQWVDELGPSQLQQWREFHGCAVLVMKQPMSIPQQGPGHRTLRWTWVRNPLDNKWMQFEGGRTGKPKKFEVAYVHVVVLFHHPEIQLTYANTNHITPGEKNMVMRAHINLGHPSLKEFVRLLKAAGTRPDIIEYVLKEFQCEGCLKERRQPTRLPAATPRTYDFNIVIGIDLLFVYGANSTEEHPILNVTCVGTLYSTFTMVHPTRRSSQLVWAAFLEHWLRVFGSPSFILMDQGLEFQGNFIEGLESHGIQPILIDRDAPYQNGITERRGGLFKEVYYKTRELRQPTDVNEVQNMVHEVSWALQTMTNRSGYSPAQRVFGKQPSLAMDHLSDAGQYEFPQTSDASWKKSEEIRQAARKAMMEVDAKERLQRAARARPRRAREDLHFVEGDPVYVWRQGKRGSQAKVGPCFVVLQKGDTVWVTRRGELWKCNKTQIFPMGNMEKQGLEAIPIDLLRAKEKIRFNSEKMGYIDVEREGDPPLPSSQQAEPSTERQSDNIQRRAPPTPRAPPEGLGIPNPSTPARAPMTPGIQRAAPSTPQLPVQQQRPPRPSKPAEIIPVSDSPVPSRATSSEPVPTTPIATPSSTSRSRSPVGRFSQLDSLQPDTQLSKTVETRTTQPSSLQQKPSSLQTQPAEVVTEGDELWRATVENQRASAPSRHEEQPQHGTATSSQQGPLQELMVWNRIDFNARRYRASNSKGPLWGDVVRRITLNLDTMTLIKDEEIKADEEISIHKLHDKLPGEGTTNIETILIYKKIPGHPFSRRTL